MNSASLHNQHPKTWRKKGKHKKTRIVPDAQDIAPHTKHSRAQKCASCLCGDTWKVPRWNVYQLNETGKKKLIARVLCKKAFCTVYLSLKFCFCVCSYQNDKNCCIGTCISPMHNIMISPLGSKWWLGTNENKDRAQCLQALKPKTSKHSDCTYQGIWQRQINSYGFMLLNNAIDRLPN